MIVSILKMLIGLFGILSTIWFLITGLFKRNSSAYKKAGFSLIATFILVGIISTIELGYYSSKAKNKKLVLSAGREAPIGGIWLKLYDNKSYTLTYDPRTEGKEGTYQIKNDTLTLFDTDTIRTSFLIKEKSLEEIKNTGIGGLSILEKH